MEKKGKTKNAKTVRNVNYKERVVHLKWKKETMQKTKEKDCVQNITYNRDTQNRATSSPGD